MAVGQSQRLYSGVGIFNWHYPSSPHQIFPFPVVPLESRVVVSRASYLGAPAGILNRFWIQVAVQKRNDRYVTPSRFGIEAVTNL